MRAVILAGGKGTRLRPYTYSLPKPLMPIGGEMPILEIILKQLKQHGFNHITMAVNYMAKIIMAFFNSGEDWGLKIDYSLEKKTLGTVGPLTLIEDLPENFLVMNGDVMTDLNFKDLYDWHVKENNFLSVCTHVKEVKIDSGVLKFNSDYEIYEFEEKPILHKNVNMGIYVVNRELIETLPKNSYYGFDQLIINAINQNYRLKAYVHDSFWADIGQNDDYRKVNQYYKKNKDILFNF